MLRYHLRERPWLHRHSPSSPITLILFLHLGLFYAAEVFKESTEYLIIHGTSQLTSALLYDITLNRMKGRTVLQSNFQTKLEALAN